jgi:hypothetical protein
MIRKKNDSAKALFYQACKTHKGKARYKAPRHLSRRHLA